MHKTFVHALVNDKGNLGIDEEVRQSLRVFYQRNLFIDFLNHNPVDSVIAATEDECLEKAAEKNFDFLILSWEGNIFDIHRYHHECIEVINALDERTQGNWLVSGHIMDQEQNRLLHNDANAAEWKNSFWLFPITAFVNIKQWIKLGKPAWGQEASNVVAWLARPSEECIHDNYTPLELTAGAEEVEVHRVRKGWNIIDAGLRQGWPVYNMPTAIRQQQTYLYPENNPDMYTKFWQSMHTMPKLNDQYKKIHETLIISKYPRRIRDTTWQCFIKNTEDYFPRSDLHGAMEWGNIDSMLFPCSGFKDLVVSTHKDTPRRHFNIIHFDIIGQCVKIKQKIIERWDGRRSTFESTLLSIGQEFVDPKTNKAQPTDAFHMHSMKSLNEAYDHLLTFFDSEQHLEESWKLFKTFNHFYIEADMLVDPYAVVKSISTENIYICLSDIAGWRNNILGYGYQNLRNDIINCLHAITRRGINGIVDYKDPGTDLQLWQSLTAAQEFLKLPPNQ
jgi:hypothetical protein